MKRNIKKAIAFALAVVTTMGNMGIGTFAAETESEEDNKVILEEKYTWYEQLEDIIVFSTKDAYSGKECTKEDEVVMIDTSGKVTKIANKNEDGTQKYSNVSSVYGGLMFTDMDGKKSLLYSSETFIGNGEKKYTDIYIFDEDYFLVQDGEYLDLIDKNENILYDNVTDDFYKYGSFKFSDAFFIKEGSYSYNKYILIDKNYKKVEDFELENVTNYTFGEDFFVAKHSDGTASLVTSEFKVKSIPLPEGNEELNIKYTGFDIYAGKYENAIEITPYDSNYKRYETFFLSIDTLKVISKDECIPFQYEPSKVVSSKNDDLKIIEYGYSFDSIVFNDGTEYRKEDLAKQAAILKGLTEIPYSSNLNVVAIDQKVYISMYMDGSIIFVLDKKDNYSLENAKRINATSMWSGRNIKDEKTVMMLEYVEGEETRTEIYNCNGKIIDTKNKVIKDYYLGFAVEDNTTNKTTLYDMECNEILTTQKRVSVPLYKYGGIVVTVRTEEIGEGDNKEIEYYYGVIRKATPSENASSQLDNVQAGEKVEVKVEKDEEITADVFEKLKECNATLVVETSSGATWTIKGSDIIGTSLKDINLNVEKVKDVVPKTAIETVKLEGEVVELSLAHTGDFGFTAELKLNLKAENKDKYANLFYFNPVSKALEFMESVKIDENGLAGFMYTHASEYAIVISDKQYEVPKEDQKEDQKEDPPKGEISPDTGDCVDFAVIIVGMAVSVCAMVSVFGFKNKKVTE